MVNKYSRKHCDKCNGIKLHNYNSCCSCAVKKSYYKNHKESKKRVLKNYYSNEYTASKIYSQKIIMSKRKKHTVCFSRNEFIEWYDSCDKKCYYCGRTEAIWNKTKSKFRNCIRLQLDRIDNNREYELKNICLCCPECNSYKGKLRASEFIDNIKIIYKRLNPVGWLPK